VTAAKPCCEQLGASPQSWARTPCPSPSLPRLPSAAPAALTCHSQPPSAHAPHNCSRLSISDMGPFGWSAEFTSEDVSDMLVQVGEINMDCMRGACGVHAGCMWCACGLYATCTRSAWLARSDGLVAGRPAGPEARCWCGPGNAGGARRACSLQVLDPQRCMSPQASGWSARMGAVAPMAHAAGGLTQTPSMHPIHARQPPQAGIGLDLPVMAQCLALALDTDREMVFKFGAQLQGHAWPHCAPPQGRRWVLDDDPEDGRGLACFGLPLPPEPVS
jgi:hypothetical protein